jgi:hypothetical protein
LLSFLLHDCVRKLSLGCPRRPKWLNFILQEAKTAEMHRLGACVAL